MKRGNKIKSKISDYGKKAIKVGYVRNSTGDTYPMYNLHTNKTSNTRDVKWTNKLYGRGIQGDWGQSDYYKALEEEDTDPESDKGQQEQPRRSRRIQSQNDTDEKVMRALKS